MKMNNICSIINLAAIISFLGFAVENVWLAVTKRYIDNRNMSLPFLLGYGLFVIGFVLVIGTPDDILIPRLNMTSDKIKVLIYFIIAFTVICFGEIALGMFTEKYFGFSYWDYSRIPLHITKYTSVPTSIGFAALFTLFMKRCISPLWGMIIRIPAYINIPAAVIAAAVLPTDFIRSFRRMHRNRKPNIIWQLNIREKAFIKAVN